MARSTSTTTNAAAKRKTRPSYKKIILKLLKERQVISSRKGVSRGAIYSWIARHYELKDEATMRKTVSKRIKELRDNKLIAPMKAYPQSFRLTPKGKKSQEAKKRGKAAVTGGARTAAVSSRRRAATSSRGRPSISSLFCGPTSATVEQPKCLWQFTSNEEGTGIFVNDKYAFMGTMKGKVYGLDRNTGEVKQTMSFPAGVKCVIGDQGWLYVGLVTGEIFDCSTGTPRLMFKLEKDNNDATNNDSNNGNSFSSNMSAFSIEWLDICDGYLAVDGKGTAALLNMEGDLIWKNEGHGTNRFVSTDGNTIFHCRQDNVTAYKFHTGEVIWTTHGGSCVTFGSSDERYIYTAPYEVHAIDKVTGETKKKYFGNTPWACATNPRVKEGEPNQVYTSDCGNQIFCYDKETCQKQWVTPTRGRRGESLQYSEGKLYCVTSDGVMSAFDVNDISASHSEGQQIVADASTEAMAIAPSTDVETTTTRDGGILVVIVKDKGKMRVRVDPSESDDFDKTLNIQFPRHLRSLEGKKYVVDELVLNNAGSFYRSRGNIKAFSG